MKVFSLFTGIGGFDLAMRNLGHEIVGACEIDKYARETYKRHFPKVPLYNDAKDLSPSSLPQYDLCVAGFPCQSFSIAGKRKGFNDNRGTLFFEIERITREGKPRYIFLENVKGLLSHDKGKTFRRIISTLDEMGYDVEWQLLNSKYFVPQNRERIFIIGHLRGERTRQIFPIGESDNQPDSTPKSPQGKGERVRSSYTRALDANYYKGGSHGSLLKQIGYINKNIQGNRVYDPNFIGPTLNANGGGWGAKTGLFDVGKIQHIINSSSQANRVYDPRGIGPTLGIGNAMSKPLVGVDDTRDFIYLSNTNANMKQREQKRSESWTLGTGGDFAIRDKMKIRRLTPLECERLQGFPDNWTKGVSDTQRYKQLGNAVTVPVVQYIAKHFKSLKDNE